MEVPLPFTFYDLLLGPLDTEVVLLVLRKLLLADSDLQSSKKAGRDLLSVSCCNKNLHALLLQEGSNLFLEARARNAVCLPLSSPYASNFVDQHILEEKSNMYLAFLSSCFRSLALCCGGPHCQVARRSQNRQVISKYRSPSQTPEQEMAKRISFNSPLRINVAWTSCKCFEAGPGGNSAVVHYVHSPINLNPHGAPSTRKKNLVVVRSEFQPVHNPHSDFKIGGFLDIGSNSVMSTYLRSPETASVDSISVSGDGNLVALVVKEDEDSGFQSRTAFAWDTRRSDSKLVPLSASPECDTHGNRLHPSFVSCAPPHGCVAVFWTANAYLCSSLGNVGRMFQEMREDGLCPFEYMRSNCMSALISFHSVEIEFGILKTISLRLPTLGAEKCLGMLGNACFSDNGSEVLILAVYKTKNCIRFSSEFFGLRGICKQGTEREQTLGRKNFLEVQKWVSACDVDDGEDGEDCLQSIGSGSFVSREAFDATLGDTAPFLAVSPSGDMAVVAGTSFLRPEMDGGSLFAYSLWICKRHADNIFYPHAAFHPPIPKSSGIYDLASHFDVCSLGLTPVTRVFFSPCGKFVVVEQRDCGKKQLCEIYAYNLCAGQGVARCKQIHVGRERRPHRVAWNSAGMWIHASNGLLALSL